MEDKRPIIRKINSVELTHNKIQEALYKYNFQKELTKRLDNYQNDFTEQTLLEIVLWKTNRYPSINQELINSLNSLRKNYSTDKAKIILRTLLDLKGFDLPMASTVLRFSNPDELQIIDQRVFRFIMPEKDKLKIPFNKDKKVEFYFDYISHLKKVCETYQIPFRSSDRILYQMDRTLNSEVPINY